MRIVVSHRLALAAAIGVMVTATSLARLPTTTTLAAQPATLSANDFHEVALQGFGDSQNSWAWGAAWFQNHLYIGTNKAWACIQQATLNFTFPFIFPYPPAPDPDLAEQCNPDPQALPESGEIWRMTPPATGPITQSNWSEVYQSPYTATVHITRTQEMTPAARDMAFRSMTVYDDVNGQQALYVSGVGTAELNGTQVPPPSLLRTTTGDGQSDFQAVPAISGTTMGDINTLPGIIGFLGGHGGSGFRGAVAYKGKFYILIGTIQGGGSVFVSSDPRQGNNSFQQLTPVGMQAFEMAPFNGHLYIGVQEVGGGYTVLQTDANCPTLPCPSAAFTQIIPPGAGLGKAGNFGVTSMYAFTDTHNIPHLYIGSDGALNGTPTEIDRINLDDSWDLIVGTPRTVNGRLMRPLSGLPSGFGWPYNFHMWRMATYQNVLYVGTFDASTLFKDYPVGPALRPFMGFDLWATVDGINFSPVTTNGFGDMFSFGARTLVPTPIGLFVGSANWWKGLRVWQGAVNPKALALAPTAVRIDTTRRGAVALTWRPSASARLYHIYRSSLVWTPLPRQGLPIRLIYGNGAGMTHPSVRAAWIQQPYQEIGTSGGPGFVDHSAHLFGHYLYYVVGEDAQGNLSMASNATAYPNLAP